MNTSKVEESATSNATRPAEVFDSCLTVNELSLYYGDSKALSDINLDIATKKVTAFLDPRVVVQEKRDSIFGHGVVVHEKRDGIWSANICLYSDGLRLV